MKNRSPVKGIDHITIAVKDVPESFRFYTRILNFKPVAKWPRGAYLLAGDVWFAMVLDSRLRRSVLPEYTHIAFTVSKTDSTSLSRKISRSGVKIWQTIKAKAPHCISSIRTDTSLKSMPLTLNKGLEAPGTTHGRV